jgi:hypothetical protein
MEKMPRLYFKVWIKVEGDKEAEREALSGLPVEWRPLLTTYIQIHKGKNNERTAKQSNQGSPAKRL